MCCHEDYGIRKTSKKTDSTCDHFNASRSFEDFPQW